MSLKFLYYFLNIAFLCMLVSVSAYAKNKGPHTFRFAGDYFLSSTYQDQTLNEETGNSGEIDSLKFKGTRIVAAGALWGIDAELDYRSLTPSDAPYWSKTTIMGISGSYYLDKLRFVAPLIGYYILSQTGDKDHPEAPPAFLDKNTSLMFGVRSSLPLIFIKKKHGVLLQARIVYLTALDQKRNFGNEIEYGGGYAYRRGKKFTLGVVYKLLHTFSNAIKVEAENQLHVRSITHSSSLGIYIQY